MPIFDAHAHLYPSETAMVALLAGMDQAGIDCAAVVGGGLVTPSQLSHWIQFPPRFSEVANLCFDNMHLLDLCRRSQDRLFPFFFANPWVDSRLYKNKGRDFYGLKLAPAIHGNKFDVFEIEEFVCDAINFDHPIYTHCLHHEGKRVKDLVNLANKFPQATFILGHAGVGQVDFSAVEEISRAQNILFETSGGFTSVIKFAIDKLGAARVLFGSEYPLEDPWIELNKIKRLQLSPRDREAVLGKNFQSLMKMETPDAEPIALPN